MGKNLASGLVRNSGFSPDTSAPRPDTKLPVSRLFGAAAHGPSEVAAKEAADLNQAERMKLAKEGKALPDGSFPIRNVTDLKKARKRAHQGDNEGAAVRLIKKRERELGVNLGPIGAE
ncbi:MAG TPA: hypothetical protein VN903_15415 [Polyangia bacterium]|nr:hypothetical protein [Polyangia bacterium]